MHSNSNHFACWRFVLETIWIFGDNSTLVGLDPTTSRQELIRLRNSHVTVAQVPTCSKFTTTKLANHSKIVFVLYQTWCKIYFCNYPLLKIQELSPQFWRNPNLIGVNYSYSQELIRPRNSHVTVAQVPTCSKFTATKLANYSKKVFVLYQIWCKIYFSNQPLLKYRSWLHSFEEIQI